MQDMRSYAFAALITLAVVAPAWGARGPGGDDAFLGRWDITARGTNSGIPRICWLEVRRDRGVLKGRFNAGGGAVFDLPQISIENGLIVFQYPGSNAEQVWKATLKNAELVGTALVKGQNLSWTGVRGPVWPITPPKRKPGKAMDLFNGKDLSGWLCQGPPRPLGWFVQDGILIMRARAPVTSTPEKNSTISIFMWSSTWIRGAIAGSTSVAGMRFRF
jgi:hypothetical protein